MKVSDCCGVPAYSNGDSDTEDIGICPSCKEHCEYIDDEEGEEEYPDPESIVTPEQQRDRVIEYKKLK